VVDLGFGSDSRCLPLLAPRSAYSIPASPPQYPALLEHPPQVWRLHSWCWFVCAASPWDPGPSRINYLRRHLQPNLLVAGALLHRWLHRPALNRRKTRLFHPGVCVFDAPTALHRQRLHLRRHGQSCPAPYRVQDLFVIRPSAKGLSVIWIL
jgi:hypothetical protein